jgi:hypothetical protein
MDKRLEQALEFSNFRMILFTRQENLKVLLKNSLILSYKGGLFNIDSNLMGLISFLTIAGEKKFIFIDNNDLPILIEDLSDFWNKVISKYRDALERYYKSYEKLKEAREIRKVIDWDGENKKG